MNFQQFAQWWDKALPSLLSREKSPQEAGKVWRLGERVCGRKDDSCPNCFYGDIKGEMHVADHNFAVECNTCELLWKVSPWGPPAPGGTTWTFMGRAPKWNELRVAVKVARQKAGVA